MTCCAPSRKTIFSLHCEKPVQFLYVSTSIHIKFGNSTNHLTGKNQKSSKWNRNNRGKQNPSNGLDTTKVLLLDTHVCWPDPYMRIDYPPTIVFFCWRFWDPLSRSSARVFFIIYEPWTPTFLLVIGKTCRKNPAVSCSFRSQNPWVSLVFILQLLENRSNLHAGVILGALPSFLLRRLGRYAVDGEVLGTPMS